MNDCCNFPGFNCNLLNECKIKHLNVDLKQKKYISYWNNTLQHSQKLNSYYKIQTNYGLPRSNKKDPFYKNISETENKQSQT